MTLCPVHKVEMIPIENDLKKQECPEKWCGMYLSKNSCFVCGGPCLCSQGGHATGSKKCEVCGYHGSGSYGYTQIEVDGKRFSYGPGDKNKPEKEIEEAFENARRKYLRMV
jgi:hypothetical protein